MNFNMILITDSNYGISKHNDDMTYEILNKIKYDKVDIENSINIYRNVELTFYLITKTNIPPKVKFLFGKTV